MHQQYSVSVTLLLIIPLISSQLIQSPSNGSKRLAFVAQLWVRGCPIFVHDTGAPDGPHLAVEPIMCLTESLPGVAIRFDSFTKQIYLSVAVMVTDDAILAEVQRRLTHLSPKSVNYATVSDISVSSYTSSEIQVLGFDWKTDDTVGFLRIGCSPYSCRLSHNALGCMLPCLKNLTKLGRKSTQRNEPELQSMNILLSAKIISNGKFKTSPYRLTMQNQSIGIPLMTPRYLDLPTCNHLKYRRSIQHNQCTARVHQRLDLKGTFLIEPLLCHNITSMSVESVIYDDTRDKYYLNLNVVLQDEATLKAVKKQLTDLSPVSVKFMRLWNAQSRVASALSVLRFEIGKMMVSGDRRSGQVRVYCESKDDCNNLRREVSSDAVNIFKHIKWILTAHVDFDCQIELSKYIGNSPGQYDSTLSRKSLTFGRIGHYSVDSDGKLRVTIQQRKTTTVSFQRNWTEYVEGFGDEENFWIGLNSIHTLSMNGVKLRVEMVDVLYRNNFYAEYDGFKVEGASTNYTMTYRKWVKSNVGADILRRHKGMQFFTKDNDNRIKCTVGSGWWWPSNYCSGGNLNANAPTLKETRKFIGTPQGRDSIESSNVDLKETKLMLII